jgi:hypothetical protein
LLPCDALIVRKGEPTIFRFRCPSVADAQQVQSPDTPWSWRTSRSPERRETLGTSPGCMTGWRSKSRNGQISSGLPLRAGGRMPSRPDASYWLHPFSLDSL